MLEGERTATVFTLPQIRSLQLKNLEKEQMKPHQTAEGKEKKKRKEK